jgi:hypothetical protein
MNNPLEQYYKEHKQTWEEIINLTGLSQRTVYYLKKKTPEQLLLVTINTALILKDTLDIDLIKFIRNNLRKT